MPVRFRLRELIEAAGISQSELARTSGVSFATVNRMCTNATKQVSLNVLDQLADVLHVSVGELFERKPAREKARRGKGK